MATLLILQTHLGGHSIDHALDLLIGIEVYGNTIPREPEEYGAGMELFQLCFNGLQYRHMFAHFNPFHELAEMFGDNIPGPGTSASLFCRVSSFSLDSSSTFTSVIAGNSPADFSTLQGSTDR